MSRGADGSGAAGAGGAAADPVAPADAPSCRWLRCRSRYGRSADGIAWQSGLSPVESYWCLRTTEPVGPDDGLAHATACAADRGCFEA